MLILRSGEIVETASFNKYVISGLPVCYISGLLYMQGGYKAGRESIASMLSSYIKSGYVPFKELYGSFSCVIEVAAQKYIVFSDNSNMHCLYYNGDVISESCIDAVRYLKSSGCQLDLDPVAVCNLYTLGKIFSGRSMIKGLNISSSADYFCVENGVIKKNDKQIGDISGATETSSIDSFLKRFSHAVEDKKCCLSLTGGYDSRCLYAVLNNYINIDPTLSGDNLAEPDIIVGSKVAQVSNKELKLVKINKPELSDSVLFDAFIEGDGVVQNISDMRMRWLGYRDYLNNSDYDICISGDGGVLHKDWEWMQDLPFYHKKTVNIQRYYKQRIACEESRYGMTADFSKEIQKQESELFSALKYLRKATNTESYDMFYNYLNGNRKLIYNRNATKNVIYAPFQELELVRYSYHLPRRKRFFYNNLRNTTTAANPDMAKLPTVYGMTACDLPLYLARDAFFQLINYAHKGFLLIYRKLTKRTIGGQSATTWSIKEELRNSDIARSAVDLCIKKGYLCQDVDIRRLSIGQIGCCIYVYYWTERIINKRAD